MAGGRRGGDDVAESAEVAAGPDDALFGYIERFAAVLVAAGFPPMPARVFVALLVTDSGRLSAAELAAMLRISPAAVSGAVRYLIQLGLVHKERVPGSRRDYYRMPGNMWDDMIRMRDQVMSPVDRAGPRGHRPGRRGHPGRRADGRAGRLPRVRHQGAVPDPEPLAGVPGQRGLQPRIAWPACAISSGNGCSASATTPGSPTSGATRSSSSTARRCGCARPSSSRTPPARSWPRSGRRSWPSPTRWRSSTTARWRPRCARRCSRRCTTARTSRSPAGGARGGREHHRQGLRDPGRSAMVHRAASPGRLGFRIR